jgi:hypothetical protein
MMKIHKLDSATADYLYSIGYLQKSWDYPLWNAMKYSGTEAVKFWRYSKEFYLNEDDVVRIAKVTIASQPFTGLIRGDDEY